MDTKPIHNTGDAEHQSWYVDFTNQWSAFLHPSRMNWIDFTFIHFDVEYSPYKASCEVSVMLLGLGVCVTYSWLRLDDNGDAGNG